MTRDTFDMFQDKPRGRFGDNESDSPIRGNDSVRSDLVDLTLVLRSQRPLAIAVSDPEGRGDWIWLPKSKIEYVMKDATTVEVSMPKWLAKDKGLL